MGRECCRVGIDWLNNTGVGIDWLSDTGVGIDRLNNTGVGSWWELKIGRGWEGNRVGSSSFLSLPEMIFVSSFDRMFLFNYSIQL